MKKYKWIVMSLCLGMALTGCQDNKAEKKMKVLLQKILRKPMHRTINR